MSRKWVCSALVMMVGGLLAAGFAQAQEGRGRGGFGARGGLMGLLANEAVQKELNIDDAQKQKLTQLAEAYGKDVRESLQAAGGGANFQNASREERAQMLTKLQEHAQKVTQKHLPALKEALQPEQFTRLQQISWQSSGAAAFQDPELVKALQLTQDQQDRLAEVRQEYQKKQSELFSGDNPREAFAKMRELNQERDQKSQEVLTAEQRQKFDELKGKPFDVSQLRGRPGGRRDNP